MARLFISHSSRNNDRAVQVRDWLIANGWDDIFLDLDPERGIVAGQRWKEALQKAAHRCEVVLALVSEEWLASDWCKSEIDAARLMGKKVIVALIGIDKARVPLDLSDEQWVDLASDPDAYRRLKEGLKRAGLDPSSFALEPGRRPYPGFAYLEEKDAAVFFGRDAQIVRGLDKLRRMSRTGVERLLVILGASGSGKSSFLRAGMWPRLKRDDRNALPLPTVRPERAVISGKFGLVQALQQAVSEPRFADGIRQRGLPRSRADIQDFIEKNDDGLARLFAALREIGQVPGSSGEIALQPTILLALDQGEELFNEEGRDEAVRFTAILTRTLQADSHALAVIAMRSDAFALLQADPRLAALPKDTFNLDMMLEGSYRAVIEGPARLAEPPLRIDPQLTDALLEDISGQDALPLLAFTLAHLYEHYAVDNELTLEGYERLGRVKGVIETTVGQAFAEGVANGGLPRDAKAQLALARAAFIPHLAQVNAAGQFVRRVAARDEIPPDARPVIDCFADQRLLIKDRRKNVEVVEVAHEALLRQPPLSDWLEDDREFLKWRERLIQARAAFVAEERGLLSGRELERARSWLQARGKDDIAPADQAFIRDSMSDDDKRRADEAERERQREAAEKDEQERRVRDAERIASEQKKAAMAQKRMTYATLGGLVVVVGLAAWVFQEYRGQLVATKLATENEEKSRINLNQALITQSRLLVDKAEQQDGDQVTRILLALEALPDTKEKVDRPVASGAQTSLTRGLDLLRELTVFGGHTERLSAAAVMPDGAGIVTGSADKTVRVWDVKTGEEKLRLTGHTDAVTAIAVTADRIVTGSVDKTVRVWDARTGAELRQLVDHTGVVIGLAATRDGTRIFAASNDGSWQVWDTQTWETLQRVSGHAGRITSVAATPDGSRIVTGSTDKTARVWDTQTGAGLFSLAGHLGAVHSVAVTPDGARIITGSDDKAARVWDARTGQELPPLTGHSGKILSVVVAPDGNRVVTGSNDGTVRMWDIRTGTELLQLQNQSVGILTIAVTPGWVRIVTSSNDNTARVWDARYPELLMLKVNASLIGGVAIAPDGTRTVTGSFDHTARVWDTKTGEEKVQLKGHTGAVNSVALMMGGARIVTGSADKTARVWDAGTGAELLKLEGHGGAVNRVAVTSDESRIVTGSADKSVRVWDALSGAEQLRLTGHDGPVESVAVTGSRIITGSADGTARVWDAKTGMELLRLTGHTRDVSHVGVTPDGKRIVTGSVDMTVRVWDVDTGVELLRLTGHTAAINGVVVTANGTRIVTGAYDGTLRVWDADTGTELRRVAAHLIGSLAATPDGGRAATGSRDGTWRLWDLDQIPPPPPKYQFSTSEAQQAVVDHAKDVVPRCLTIAQRKTFLLAPTPPSWCITMSKFPYDEKLWKAWIASNTEGAIDSKTAGDFGDFSDQALKDGDFPKALEAADLSIRFDPTLIWTKINRAHAFMFLGRLDEARDAYHEHRGETVPNKGLWEQLVVDDFALLRDQGRRHSLMVEIEDQFKPAIAAARAKK